MLSTVKSWFKKAPRKIAFLDGDQPIPGIIAAHQKYLKGVETHLVRLEHESRNEPILLRNIDKDINKIYLRGYTNGKEVVDKFIGAYIQKALSDGYTDITVVSSDYDFIDIFKMAVQLNPSAAAVTFRMVIPNGQGRVCDLPAQLLNIEVLHEAPIAPDAVHAAKIEAKRLAAAQAKVNEKVKRAAQSLADKAKHKAALELAHAQ